MHARLTFKQSTDLHIVMHALRSMHHMCCVLKKKKEIEEQEEDFNMQKVFFRKTNGECHYQSSVDGALQMFHDAVHDVVTS